MILMQAPPDVAAVSHAGQTLEIKEGLIALDESCVELFRAHGFTPAPSPERKPTSAKTEQTP